MKEKTKKMTFKEVYDSLPKVTTPKMEFVAHIAAITFKSENAVRMWLAGVRQPDALTQKVIEQDLGIPASSLFPSN